MKTFLTLITRARDLFGNLPAYQIPARSGVVEHTFAEFYEDVCNLAAALTSYNLGKVALLGENSYDWVVAYMATVVSGGTIVPIDKELTEQEIENIVRMSDAGALFCSNDYSEVADHIKNKSIVKEIFAINTPTYNGYTTLNQLIEAGAKLRIADKNYGQGENSAQAIASVVFTSGTTGVSKGVMLSRENLLANVISADKFITLGSKTLSILPMHHTYEFTLDILFSIYQGRTVAINNSVKYLAQNMQTFSPTDILIVPLVAEALLSNIWKNAQAQGKADKLRKGLKLSRALKSIGIDIRRKLFKDIHWAFGGQLRGLFIGGALLNKDTARMLHDLGFVVNIGYGITECSPLVTGNITDKVCFFDSCGVPIPGVEIRLAESGEIEVRGSSVMQGYYKNPQATKEAFNGGWFRTGDIGTIKKGMLYITGRVKNLIVLKNGKNIYPEELELIIEQIPAVKEVVVGAREGTIAGEELSLYAEIFPDTEVPEPHKDIEAAIAILNEKLPYYKRITNIVFREKEFAKTTTKKIKRY